MLQADPTEEQAVRFVKEVGGKILRDEKADGKPVIKVELVLPECTIYPMNKK